MSSSLFKGKTIEEIEHYAKSGDKDAIEFLKGLSTNQNKGSMCCEKCQRGNYTWCGWSYCECHTEKGKEECKHEWTEQNNEKVDKFYYCNKCKARQIDLSPHSFSMEPLKFLEAQTKQAQNFHKEALVVDICSAEEAVESAILAEREHIVEEIEKLRPKIEFSKTYMSPEESNIVNSELNGTISTINKVLQAIASLK